ncbi:MAG: serine/threonine-protein kinase [Cyanobacteriota bacterium]
MSLKNYEIIKQVGSGGMGTVHLARDPRLQRMVAIKTVKIPPVSQAEARNEVKTRFYREARALALLNHPNIVSVYDLGEDETSCFMVMEYLNGKDLEALVIDNGVLAEDFIVPLMTQVCDALSYIHDRQIIHRDIKPANIIYCDNTSLKIMDFGLVRMDDNLHLTKAGTIMGSILYMSPEQIQNPKNVDYKTDIYAFGITLYYILSGNFPYYGENAFEIIRSVTLDEPIRISKYLPSISPNLEKIIMKIISKEKEDRYQDMQEIKRELLSYKKENILANSINQNISFNKTIITNDLLKKSITDTKTVIINTSPEKKNETENNSNDSLKYLLMNSESEINIRPNSSSGNSLKNIISKKSNDYFNTKNLITTPKVPEKILRSIISSKNEEDIKEVLYKYPKNISNLDSNDIRSIKEFDNNNKNEMREINKSLRYLENIKDTLIEEISKIDKELFDLKKRNISSNSETQDKIDSRTSQKKLKDSDLTIIKEKFDIYTLLIEVKRLKSQINFKLVEYISKPEANTFFDEDYNIFNIPEEIAEMLKDFVEKKLSKLTFYTDSFTRIEKLIISMEKIEEFLVDDSSPHLIVSSFLPKTGYIKANVLKDTNNNSLIEIDINNYHTLFTYAYITRDGRYVPRAKKTDEIMIKSDIFNDLDYSIKDNAEIFLSKFKTINKKIIQKEITSYKEIQSLVQNMIEIYEDNILRSFEFLASMFVDLPMNISGSVEFNKQLIISKYNKIKKSLLDLKKMFENSDKPLYIEYFKNINTIILVLNRFPNLIRDFEENIKQKKEQRKRIFQNIIMQINKAPQETIRKDLAIFQKTVTSINSNIIPQSIIDFLSFYLLYKSKLPTNISKNQIVEELNNDKNKLNALEIDCICNFLNVNYTKETGFYLR